MYWNSLHAPESHSRHLDNTVGCKVSAHALVPGEPEGDVASGPGLHLELVLQPVYRALRLSYTRIT